MYNARQRSRVKPPIEKETVGWPLGYRSTGVDGVIAEEALGDMTNMDMSQNSLPYIRFSTVPYGKPFIGKAIGNGTYEKTIIGMMRPEHWEISLQVVPVNELQTLSITGSPTGGSFTLTFSGQTTAAIAYNATAAAVQSALEALSNIAVGDVLCAGGALPGSPVTITFKGAYANTDVAAITATSSLTGGSTPAVVITETTKGGDTAKLYNRKDGGAWNLINHTYSFDITKRSTFTQSAGRVYITNGINKLTYYDIAADDVISYTQISKPAAPTPTQHNLTGTTYTLYYVITALSEAGQTDGSVEGTVQVSKLREDWNGSTENVTLAFTLPTGNKGGNVYVGTAPGNARLIGNVPQDATTFTDTGVATTVTITPPLTNSTGGPILRFLVNITGQLFGWGDKDNPSFIWYDGGSTGTSGNFTISGGGGYVAIDENGPTVPMQVLGYRTGKGDPVPTVICSAPAGSGVVRHISFTPETIGSLTALMPSVSDGNGDMGSISPMAGVAIDNSIHFPTGRGFAFEGSAPNIPNILSANRSSDFIQPDVEKLNLDAMDGAIGLAHQAEGAIYWALPVISSTNNQIWKLDLRSNPARWIMPWLIPAEYMWLYEDNSGDTHFCLLVNGVEVEFTDSVSSSDNGQPFHTRLASGPIFFDKGGISVGHVQHERFRMYNEHGKIKINVDGTDEYPMHSSLDIDASIPVENTGFGEFEWGVDDWGADPHTTSTPRVKSKTESVEIKAKLNGFRWEILTSTVGCGYSLGATHTEGVMIPKLYAGS